MARGGHGFPKVSLWPTIPYLSTPCGRPTPGTTLPLLPVFYPFGHPTPYVCNSERPLFWLIHFGRTIRMGIGSGQFGIPWKGLEKDLVINFAKGKGRNFPDIGFEPECQCHTCVIIPTFCFKAFCRDVMFAICMIIPTSVCLSAQLEFEGEESEKRTNGQINKN
jgi:hypothetical protein